MVVRIDQGLRKGDFLVLAQTLVQVDSSVDRLTRLLMAVAPIALLAAATGGWFVARRALRPVDAMTQRAAELQASGPYEPLPVPPADDELSRLAGTLNNMLDRLKRAMDTERRFAADASHELRTPLGIMEAELDVALRSRRTPEAAKEVLQSVKEEATALSRIVANLLILSRAESAGAVAIDRHPADLLDVAHRVANTFGSLADERGIALRVDGSPATTSVDSDLLGQAVSNLVDNAIGHTKSGGTVVLTVTDGTVARLSVSDDGIGIPAEELPKIFDRFYRVDAARSRRRGGSGLGLEIARRIVDAHGGELSVVSEPGRGSTFTVSLPATVDTGARIAN